MSWGISETAFSFPPIFFTCSVSQTPIPQARILAHVAEGPLTPLPVWTENLERGCGGQKGIGWLKGPEATPALARVLLILGQ